MAKELAHIQQGHLADSVFDNHCVSLSVGPLSIEACVDTSVPSASITVKLAGVTIGHCQLSPDHQDCKVGGGVDGFKAEVKFALSGNCITFEAIVETPFKTWKKKGNLYCW